MPYQNEYAGNLANQHAMTGNTDIAKSLRMTPKKNNYPRLDATYIHQFQGRKKIEQAIVIDGSKYESEIESQYSSKLVLFNINQSCVNLALLQDYLKKDFPLPQDYLKISQDHSLQLILPTQGFSNDTYHDEADFFRYSIFKTFQSLENPFLDALPPLLYRESLMGTYSHLLQRNLKTQPCPKCHHISYKDFVQEGSLMWQSVCKCKIEPREVYITDFLSLHAQLGGENEALTTQLMLILEKLLFINLLRNLYANRLYDIIEKTAFILDGSLAMYSHAAWLSQAIHQELSRLQEEHPVLILGVEKTGSFVEHVRKVENFYPDTAKQSIFPFDDRYIKQYIKTYDNDNYYGEKTYFGKKIYYKNKLGASFIINIAFANEEDKALLYNARNTGTYIEQIYAIEDIAWLFDNFSSSSYSNAFSLLSFAHKGAALSNAWVGRYLLDKFLKTVVIDS